MPDESERVDPKGTMETVPPPKGESDAYSAQTRVGTMPEQVLEAMRQRESDAALASRSKSGMRPAQRPRFAAPAVPAFPEVEAPTTPAAPAPTSLAAVRTGAPPPLPRAARLITPRPMGAPSPPSQRPLPPPSPLGPLALTPDVVWPTPSAEPSSMAPSSSVQPLAIVTPHEGWLAGGPAPHGAPASGTLASAPAMALDDVPVTHDPAADMPLYLDRPHPQSYVTPTGRRSRELVRSLMVIGVFALLGGLLAAAITLVGQ